jgi:hypothetical protein
VLGGEKRGVIVKEVDVDGIFFAPIAANLVLALIVYHFAVRLLDRRLEGNVWHPQLFKFCLFAVILCLLTLSTL